tara:strand:- start:1111 stop:1329 length:219 start_codon:yes stop_codon:yes gene_type:complete
MNFKKDFINEIVDLCIQEISQKEIKEKLNTHLVEPSLTYLFERMYPYIIITSVVFILILLMAIFTIYILVRK